MFYTDIRQRTYNLFGLFLNVSRILFGYYYMEEEVMLKKINNLRCSNGILEVLFFFATRHALLPLLHFAQTNIIKKIKFVQINKLNSLNNKIKNM